MGFLVAHLPPAAEQMMFSCKIKSSEPLCCIIAVRGWPYFQTLIYSIHIFGDDSGLLAQVFR